MGELQERITEKIQLTNPPILLLGWIQEIIEEMKTEFPPLNILNYPNVLVIQIKDYNDVVRIIQTWFEKWLL